jgi:hypothetical protein
VRQRYKNSIETFCKANGVEIPTTFYRQVISRYAAVDVASSPPRLVTKTWFNKEGVAYYLQNQPDVARLRVLDFHDYREMIYDGVSVQRGQPFQ